MSTSRARFRSWPLASALLVVLCVGSVLLFGSSDTAAWTTAGENHDEAHAAPNNEGWLKTKHPRGSAEEGGSSSPTRGCRSLLNPGVNTQRTPVGSPTFLVTLGVNFRVQNCVDYYVCDTDRVGFYQYQTSTWLEDHHHGSTTGSDIDHHSTYTIELDGETHERNVSIHADVNAGLISACGGTPPTTPPQVPPVTTIPPSDDVCVPGIGTSNGRVMPVVRLALPPNLEWETPYALVGNAWRPRPVQPTPSKVGRSSGWYSVEWEDGYETAVWRWESGDGNLTGLYLTDERERLFDILGMTNPRTINPRLSTIVERWVDDSGQVLDLLRPQRHFWWDGRDVRRDACLDGFQMHWHTDFVASAPRGGWNGDERHWTTTRRQPAVDNRDTVHVSELDTWDSPRHYTGYDPRYYPFTDPPLPSYDARLDKHRNRTKFLYQWRFADTAWSPPVNTTGHVIQRQRLAAWGCAIETKDSTRGGRPWLRNKLLCNEHTVATAVRPWTCPDPAANVLTNISVSRPGQAIPDDIAASYDPDDPNSSAQPLFDYCYSFTPVVTIEVPDDEYRIPNLRTAPLIPVTFAKQNPQPAANTGCDVDVDATVTRTYVAGEKTGDTTNPAVPVERRSGRWWTTDADGNPLAPPTLDGACVYDVRYPAAAAGGYLRLDPDDDRHDTVVTADEPATHATYDPAYFRPQLTINIPHGHEGNFQWQLEGDDTARLWTRFRGIRFNAIANGLDECENRSYPAFTRLVVNTTSDGHRTRTFSGDTTKLLDVCVYDVVNHPQHQYQPGPLEPLLTLVTPVNDPDTAEREDQVAADDPATTWDERATEATYVYDDVCPVPSSMSAWPVRTSRRVGVPALLGGAPPQQWEWDWDNTPPAAFNWNSDTEDCARAFHVDKLGLRGVGSTLTSAAANPPQDAEPPPATTLEPMVSAVTVTKL